MTIGTNWNRNVVGIGRKVKFLLMKWMRFEKSKPFIEQLYNFYNLL